MRLTGVVVLFLLLAFPALAGDAPPEPSTGNAEYYNSLIEIFFNLFLKIGKLLAFSGLALISWLMFRHIKNPSLFQQFRLKPITTGKYVGGLVVVSILYMPLQMMSALGDLTGLVNSSEGLKLCTVMEVNVSGYSWEDEAASCISDVEEKIKRLATYTSEESIEGANIETFVGAVQLVSLGFFLAAGWSLIKHVAGFENVKITVGQSIMAMIFSSALMASPNIVEFVEDLRPSSAVVET
jgi:hypothetical protein